MTLTPSSPPQPASQRRSALVLALLVGLIVLALVGAATGAWLLISERTEKDPSSPAPSSAAPSVSPSAPTATPTLTEYYEQKLTWKDCDGFECADLRVPMDYQKPAGAEIKIALLRAPAGEPSQRIGALVVNPGGPGGSGVNFAKAGSSQFGSELTDRFDIVGFDPRGVGRSRPVKCLSTAKLDEVVAFDPDPDTPAEVARMGELFRQFGQGCLDESGAIARHISTKDVARDLDVLRAALGESKLDYLGSSYGTFLGATYAELFPMKVGRFVLDGAIDPSLSTLKLSLQQAKGFETALRAYVAQCVESADCFLGSSVDAGIAKIQDLLVRLDARPLPGDGTRELTEGLGMVGLYMPLYAKGYWPWLTDALKNAFAGDGSGLLQLSDNLTGRKGDGYEDNSLEALNAVNCLDHADSIGPAEVAGYIAQFEKAAPTFGRSFAYSASACSTWPVRSGVRPAVLQAKGAPTIVVIGTTRDPATPLVWAQALAAQLDSGRLITRDGDGHTAFQRGSTCVDDAVEAFLIDGKLPQPDLMCG